MAILKKNKIFIVLVIKYETRNFYAVCDSNFTSDHLQAIMNKFLTYCSGQLSLLPSARRQTD